MNWPKYIRPLRQQSCLMCLGQSGGLIHSNVPPEISHDISLLYLFLVSLFKSDMQTYNSSPEQACPLQELAKLGAKRQLFASVC